MYFPSSSITLAASLGKCHSPQFYTVSSWSMSQGWVRISTSIRIQEFQAAGPVLRSPDPTSSCITALLFKHTLTVRPVPVQWEREILLRTPATKIKLNGSLPLTVNTTPLQVPHPTQKDLRLPSRVTWFICLALQFYTLVHKHCVRLR